LFGFKYFFAEDFFNIAQNSSYKSAHPLLKYHCKKDFVQLLKILKNYHFETYRHSITVARLSFLISRELGISPDEIIANTIGGLLHDIGKIKIKPLLLCKPTKLTQLEWGSMKKHPHFGVHILSAFPWGSMISPIISYHHERIDGNGYYGLRGNSIPLGSKIISIADSFEAMISPRPYQKSLSLTESWEEIQNNSGSQFDPELVQILIKVTSKYKL